MRTKKYDYAFINRFNKDVKLVVSAENFEVAKTTVNHMVLNTAEWRADDKSLRSHDKK